jgi:hypothetical protein
MKNFFSLLGFKSKRSKISPGKPDIKLPFSRSSGDSSMYDKPSAGGKANKTMAGMQQGKPGGSHPTKSSAGEVLCCQQCQYPLRVEPSRSSPCPNCGYSGLEGNQANTVFNMGKTMAVSGLEEAGDQGIDEFKFKLIEESSKSEIKIQSEDPEVVLNRDYLDPGNMSISGTQHVLIRFRDHKMYIEDVSSNGSTFLQVKNTMKIRQGSRLVLGNKICLFNVSEQNQKSPDADKATRKMGGFELNQRESLKGFELIDDKTGKKAVFAEEHVIVNRVNLDTGNNTISGSRHAEFNFENGNWYIRDLSSTGATFIQVASEMQLEDNVKIIVGNKVYTFAYD